MFLAVVANNRQEGEVASQSVVIFAVELRVLSLEEGDSGSSDDHLQVSDLVQAQGLHCLLHAADRFCFLAIQSPDLHSVHDVGVVLDVVHLANGLVVRPVEGALDDDG